MFCVSACVDAKKSRLLSWPMYFWYTRGSPFSVRLSGMGLRMYRVGHELVPVRIGMNEENDAVVQEPHCLLVRPADHLVDALDQLLRAESLRRVKAAIDPHDSLSLAGEPVRLIVAQPLRQGEPAARCRRYFARAR